MSPENSDSDCFEDVPANCRNSQKKHPCPDCYFCQWCSEDRCRLCRKKEPPRPHLGFKEQIALYERLNRKTDSGGS